MPEYGGAFFTQFTLQKCAFYRLGRNLLHVYKIMVIYHYLQNVWVPSTEVVYTIETNNACEVFAITLFSNIHCSLGMQQQQ
jgi:hypothetical protein